MSRGGHRDGDERGSPVWLCAKARRCGWAVVCCATGLRYVGAQDWCTGMTIWNIMVAYVFLYVSSESGGIMVGHGAAWYAGWWERMSGGLGVGVSCGGVIGMVCQCKFILVGHSSQQNALYVCRPNAAV